MSRFDQEFDFVVVGSGGGSLCAGLVMREQGKSVLILEKADRFGGTTARSGGTMWIPNNTFQKRDGVPDSAELAETYLNALIGDDPDAPGASPERRRAYIREASRMIDFIVGKGVKLDRGELWPDYYDELDGGSGIGRTVVPSLFDLNKLGKWKDKLAEPMLPVPVTVAEGMLIANKKQSWKGKVAFAKVACRVIWSKLTGKHLTTCGHSLQGQMLYAAVHAGVDLLADAPVEELIVEDGAVVGVVATQGGRKRRIGARLGVLVNAGGFAQNQQMRDKYLPGTRNEWSLAAPGDTGEMIVEMVRQGAATAQMGERIGFQTTLPPGSENHWLKPGVQGLTALPHAILVDQSGRRYLNEGGSYMAYCKTMMERHKTVPAVPSWAIFDSQHTDKYMLNGTPPGAAKPQAWYDQGYLRKGDTIEQLAHAIEVAPGALRETVERFNRFVDAGVDADFRRGARRYDNWLGDQTHRPSPALGKLSRGPYYAIPVYPGDVGTYGGVVTDAHARVLREDGTVIPGLYATGVSTASVMGGFYPGAGGSVAPSLTWGYVAARHAAGVSG